MYVSWVATCFIILYYFYYTIYFIYHIFYIYTNKYLLHCYQDFVHPFNSSSQLRLNIISCMVLTPVNADIGGHFNLVIGLLVFRRRRAKSDSKLQALCPDLDHQAFQAFWGNSRKLVEKGKTYILSRLKLYTYGDDVSTLIKIMFLVSSCYFIFKSYSSLMC